MRVRWNFDTMSLEHSRTRREGIEVQGIQNGTDTTGDVTGYISTRRNTMKSPNLPRTTNDEGDSEHTENAHRYEYTRVRLKTCRDVSVRTWSIDL